MKIVILYSGTAANSSLDEQDVLIQVDAVTAALKKLGHDVYALAVRLNLEEAVDKLAALRPELVFNLMESLSGHDRLAPVVPSVLDAIAIPYTGASADALFLTSNKLLAKTVLKANGIATPPWVTSADGVSPMLTGDVIIKSVWDHASRGIDENSILRVDGGCRLQEEIAARRESLGGDCFAEAFIDGREFNVSLLAGKNSPQVLPPAEIRFGASMPGGIRIVGYRAKWVEDSDEYLCTNRHFDFPAEDEPLLTKLKDIASRCWKIFSLKGYARVDFRVDAAGAPWVLEINANPCLSPDAGFAAALQQAGMTFSDAVERIVEDAVGPKY